MRVLKFRGELWLCLFASSQIAERLGSKVAVVFGSVGWAEVMFKDSKICLFQGEAETLACDLCQFMTRPLSMADARSLPTSPLLLLLPQSLSLSIHPPSPPARYLSHPLLRSSTFSLSLCPSSWSAHRTNSSRGRPRSSTSTETCSVRVLKPHSPCSIHRCNAVNLYWWCLRVLTRATLNHFIWICEFCVHVLGPVHSLPSNPTDSLN